MPKRMTKLQAMDALNRAILERKQKEGTEMKQVSDVKTEYRRVGDVAGDRPFGDLPLLPFDTLLDTDVMVLDVSEREGKFGKFIVIKCQKDGDMFITTTGGVVVRRKLLKCKEQNALPALAMFTKPARYYDVI